MQNTGTRFAYTDMSVEVKICVRLSEKILQPIPAWKPCQIHIDPVKNIVRIISKIVYFLCLSV